jgi:hypothetical protein
MTDTFKRAAALGAATVAMTAGALFGAVGSASATPAHHGPSHPGPDRGRNCWHDRGYFTRVWIPAHFEHGRWQRGHMANIWHPGHRGCRR